jgi:hypothetical protein
MMIDVSSSIKKYMNGRVATGRYSSFDYCYNYFYEFYKQDKIQELSNEKNLQMSCMHLGFYLASWGMFRPSSFLINKSGKHFEELIIEISKMDSDRWEIDVINYDKSNVKDLIDCKEEIIDALGRSNAKTWDTLVSKIMLGVFGNVPAFDTFFKKSRIGVKSFNEQSLHKIQEFYRSNKSDFDSCNISTLDFSGVKTDNKYTIAKLIDMYGFIDGQKK